MQLLNSNTTQRLFFTATENMSTGDWLYLSIRHIATNNLFFLDFPKSSNVSTYTERWDGFDVSIPAIPIGQCEFTLYEGTEGATSVESSEIASVVECGLYEVITAENTDDFVSNPITYFEPNL
jgi:hypothetical protein